MASVIHIPSQETLDVSMNCCSKLLFFKIIYLDKFWQSHNKTSTSPEEITK